MVNCIHLGAYLPTAMAKTRRPKVCNPSLQHLAFQPFNDNWSIWSPRAKGNDWNTLKLLFYLRIALPRSYICGRIYSAPTNKSFIISSHYRYTFSGTRHHHSECGREDRRKLQISLIMSRFHEPVENPITWSVTAIEPEPYRRRSRNPGRLPLGGGVGRGRKDFAAESFN